MCNDITNKFHQSCKPSKTIIHLIRSYINNKNKKNCITLLEQQLLQYHFTNINPLHIFLPFALCCAKIKTFFINRIYYYLTIHSLHLFLKHFFFCSDNASFACYHHIIVIVINIFMAKDEKVHGFCYFVIRFVSAHYLLCLTVANTFWS